MQDKTVVELIDDLFADVIKPRAGSIKGSIKATGLFSKIMIRAVFGLGEVEEQVCGFLW